MECVLDVCGRYEIEKIHMMTGLQKTGRIEGNNKNILECRGRGEGRKVIFRFLTLKGLVKRL